MKKSLVVLCLFMFALSATAQKKKRNAKALIEVDGVCMMCKKRIEKAALGMKGVKYAVWNVKTHELSVILDERKTSVKAIKEKVAGVGHDTKEVKATDTAYANLHPCCKYRNEEIRKDHEGEGK